MSNVAIKFPLLAVEPTNNRSERNVRREAEVRKGGRTSKTEHGAERRGIIMTVLATLNTRFEVFRLKTLFSVVFNLNKNYLNKSYWVKTRSEKKYVAN